MTYWEKRQQQLNSQMEKDEEKLKKRLSFYLDMEYRRLEKEIAAYYSMYGEDKVIEYRNLMQNLPEEDKKKLIERMQDFAQLYPEYADLLPVRESIYKLNRLEGLQYTIRMQQLEIGAVEIEQITAHLSRQAMRGVNAAAETLGFGKDFYSNSPDVTKLFVNVAWSNGENFSERIWGNTSKLAYYLNTDIAQGIARGDSYARLVTRLRKRFGDVSRNDAYRLIYTEGTYVMAEATMQPFIDDFQKYRLSTVGDADVCDICRGVSEEVFDIADRQPGVNFPPLHPWCRCTFTIEVDNWDAWMDDYERRHGNGQAEKVENRMNPDIINSSNTKEDIALNKIRSLGKIKKEVIEKEFGKIQTDEIVVTDERARHIKARHPEDYALFQKYGAETVNDPELIIRDGKNNGTVFMIRKLPDTNLNVVVRVALETDEEGLKNSVMTFYRIRERNLKKMIEKNSVLIKKDSVLYKKE
ncbi:MAG: minor capsid protein [[Clostridium] scindens]|uniref:minor capsid protein n=1 Tax=Clostridium scindens (strain JCM 10418 / VPI 12708) TaxID=29347 RepID=UPI00399496CD